ncbi:carboxypeptidase-like regulatory domain-containing protein [Algoriphagus marinus]|uniref:carboxypeptidase-like regulatory domain-containing protein n=1 Tax=Algoriphagus marinus TaxID=1925762 RepID=UPI0009F95C39|nr:carboxypeptidase-like regulatory domain-containing protein [Algoriphagus marinus]
MKKILFVLSVLLFPLLGYSQGLVSGKVIRADNSEPVPFVNIIITELGKGTVSTMDGDFNFRLPANAEPEMEIIFSHIGFESTRMKVADLGSSTLEVEMIPSEYDLDQAIVLDFSPEVILERVKDNLINTQYGKPHEMEVFYRELIWGNDTIQGLSRARGYLHSEGYQEKHSSKANVSGNHYNMLSFDQIQKSNYGILTDMTGGGRGALGDFIFEELIFRMWDFKVSWFDYELLGGKKIGERDVFVLAIKAKNSGIKRKSKKWGFSSYGFLEDAVFYIDQEDYGVHMMELSQQYDGDREKSKYRRQVYAREKREGVVKYQRNADGDYLFTFANYVNHYTDFGYDTEEKPKIWKVKEYAELYATDYDFVNLDKEQLRQKYKMGIGGESPNRALQPHPDLYNGWIFIAGEARYNPSFWNAYDFPSFPDEKMLEMQLSSKRPLETQFSEFKNNQFYLFSILRRRHRLRENYWDRTGLYNSYASY